MELNQVLSTAIEWLTDQIRTNQRLQTALNELSSALKQALSVQLPQQLGTTQTTGTESPSADTAQNISASHEKLSALVSCFGKGVTNNASPESELEISSLLSNRLRDVADLLAGNVRGTEQRLARIWRNEEQASDILNMSKNAILVEALKPAYELAAQAAQDLDAIKSTTNQEHVRDRLKRAAIAQCALRSLRLNLDLAPCDLQISLYEAVRSATQRHGIYLPQYLRSTDNITVAEAQLLIAKTDKRFYRTQFQPPSSETVRPQNHPAASLLANKTVLLIGGDERPDHAQKLVQELGLKALRWLPTRAHQALAPIRQAASAGDVDLVLLAIRWASHSYGEVSQICSETNIPLVRLPAGLNPQQVAEQVFQQASKRLAANAREFPEIAAA